MRRISPRVHVGRGAWQAYPGCMADTYPLRDELAGESAGIRAVRRSLETVAASHSTVLLTGETGTGKGVAARTLHRHSARRMAPFVHVDCAALSPALIESELFGHERGAFTGAAERRTGRFEQAAEGTIFLDEIAELSPPLQGKLLRVLQDREYERLGSARTLRMRARVVAATSRDLGKAVRDGSFRPDLFYRLAVVTLRLPPLRQRLEDLPVLVASGLARLAPPLGGARPPGAPEFLDALRRRPWPGNVRELLNLLERLLVHGQGARLDPGALQALEEGDPVAPAVEPPGHGAPDDAALIARALEQTGGNVARAARRLGLARTTLRHRIVRHGLAHLIPRD